MFDWIDNLLLDKPKQYKKYGWLRDIPDFRDQYKGYVRFTCNHNKDIDLRDKFPKVYDQGKLGSCTANALAALCEFTMKSTDEIVYTPSRLFLYYNQRDREGTINSDSGSKIKDGIKSLLKTGIIPEKEWKYEISKFCEKPPKESYISATIPKSIRYSKIFQNINHIKESLQNSNPIIFGFSVYESFEYSYVGKTGYMIMPEKGEKLLGGHVALIVGYNEEKQVVIVRNSWGEDWGDKGYFYMPYDYVVDLDLSGDLWILETHIEPLIIPDTNIQSISAQ